MIKIIRVGSHSRTCELQAVRNVIKTLTTVVTITREAGHIYVYREFINQLVYRQCFIKNDLRKHNFIVKARAQFSHNIIINLVVII